MKYFKTTNTYKASNVSFNANDELAWSYDWWCFFQNGIFNNCNYSPTTTKHQYKVKELLKTLNIPIILELRFTRKGLQGGLQDALQDEIHLINEKIKTLETLINSPKTQERVNINRREQIKELLKHLDNVLKKVV